MSELPAHEGMPQPDRFLSRTPDLDIRLASLGGQSIAADRLTFSDLDDLAAIESCNVLLVPTGGCIAEVPSMRDGRGFVSPHQSASCRTVGWSFRNAVGPGIPADHTGSHEWSKT